VIVDSIRLLMFAFRQKLKGMETPERFVDKRALHMHTVDAVPHEGVARRDRQPTAADTGR
jgi:hypothetical protein